MRRRSSMSMNASQTITEVTEPPKPTRTATAIARSHKRTTESTTIKAGEARKENSSPSEPSTEVPRLVVLLKPLSGTLLVVTAIYLMARYFAYAHSWVTTDNA